MKRLLSLLILLIVCHLTVYGQYTWFDQNSTTTDPIDAIYVAEPGNAYGLAGTENGKVLKTNNGQTWAQVATIPEVNSLVESDWIKGIYMEDGVGAGNAILVTRSGRVYKSTDGGYNWNVVYQIVSGYANDLTVGTDRIAISAGTMVFWTDDFGGVWDSAAVPMAEAIGLSYANDMVGFVTGDNSIAMTTDGGDNWTPLSGFSTAPILYSVDAISTTSFVAVGANGYCCKYVSGAWTYPDLVGTTENMFDIHFGTATYGVVVGDNNHVFQTSDAGATWTQDSPSSSNTTAFYRAHCQNNEFAWIGGSEGSLFGSPDNPVELQIIDIVNPDTICVGGVLDYTIVFVVNAGVSVNQDFQFLLNGTNPHGSHVYYPGTVATGDTGYFDLTATINNCNGQAMVLSAQAYSTSSNIIAFYGLGGDDTLHCVDPEPHSVSGPHEFCPGESITIFATGGDSYNWLGNVDAPLSPLNVVTPSVDTKYAIIIEQEYCTVMDTVYAFLGSECEPVIIDTIQSPTTAYAFSPNGDNVNDVFVLDYLVNFPKNNVSIYNRWGDLIAHIPNYDNETFVWNGTFNGIPVGAGTYYFIVEYNGTSSTGWVQIVQ